MDADESGAHAALLSELNKLGLATSAALQAALRRSQPSVSRLLTTLSPPPLVLGAGRRTQYALPQGIHGAAAQQPLHWVHEDGRIEAWGRLSFIKGNRIHVQAPGVERFSVSQLPWFMAPLRAEGFLGRLLAQRLQIHGLGSNPELWPLEHQLFAALQSGDAPGALVLGEPQSPTHAQTLGAAVASYDDLADSVARTFPAGSSAGGEQAKFLTRREDGAAVLVKFTPPRGTPFGERWHDLLHTEALALEVLAEFGVPVAATRIIETPRRTYLESLRFDRIGAAGRRHVVPLHAVHEAFVGGPRQHWAATCDTLVRQRRLPPEATAQVLALLQFGRLIGNTDMHFGNLALFVAPGDVAAGRFTLAPLYDMLSMRWRPDPTSGELFLTPFEPMPLDMQSAARPVALVFWRRAAGHAALSEPFRRLAAGMARRLAAP